MKQRNAEILLIIVIASRSISYLLSKIGLNGIPPLELLAIRFALTTLILLLLFHRRLPLLTRQLWKAAGLLGTFLFACMACELISLTTIPSSDSGLPGKYIRRLGPDPNGRRQPPLAGKASPDGYEPAPYRHRLSYPARRRFPSGTGRNHLPDRFRLLRHLDLPDRPPGPAVRPIAAGDLANGIPRRVQYSSMVLFESPAVPADTTTWGAILALVFICSVFGFTFQPVAQKYTSAEKAGLFTALNPLIAAVLASFS